MLPYLHILIRVEKDGSLHALGAFTTKEKQSNYLKASGLESSHVRLDFYNGPFDEAIKVIYAGHRRWNMDRFQLAGYFKSEGEAWNWVTQEGYVSVLKIDTTYEEEKALEKEALERYAKLQKRWRLSSYEDLVAREGADKARANIMLRFYEDALESFKPKTRRDIRALYAFSVLILFLPIAIYIFLSQAPEYGENMPAVSWLPSYTSNISYYRSKKVQVYEFKVSPENFKLWAESSGLSVRKLISNETLSRYSAYMPKNMDETTTPEPVTAGSIDLDQFKDWQSEISVQVTDGLIANRKDDESTTAVYDSQAKKAYFESILSL